MDRSTFIYVTYIRTTPEKLWAALTGTDFILQYWFGFRCESEWTAGSSWKLLSPSGEVFDSGKILEAVPPRRLVIRWRNMANPELAAEGDSICTMELEAAESSVKLTITHSIERKPSKFIDAVSNGWPKVISNLKSLMETGSIVLAEPYPAGTRS